MATSEIIKTLEERFAKECKVINLIYEYPGYTGTERYILISPLSESELHAKYASLLTMFIPYIVLPVSFGKARSEFVRNEHKHRVRMKCGNNFDVEDDLEEHHPEVCTPDFTSILYQESNERLNNAIQQLRKKQRERLFKMYYEGYSNDEIAANEGVSASAVSQSINSALKKLEEILQKP